MTAPRTDKPCDACGVPLTFLPGPKGHAIPLQKIRTVYRLALDGESVEKVTIFGGVEDPGTETIEEATLYVSHFETCPNASRFSRRSRG